LENSTRKNDSIGSVGGAQRYDRVAETHRYSALEGTRNFILVAAAEPVTDYGVE
jgi:hypothetical protein